MNQGTILGSQIGRWIILATLVVVLGALLLTIRPVIAQSTPPGAPTGLTAKAVGVVGTGAVELSWTAPVSGRDSVTGYKIETSSNDGTTWTESVADTETVNTASGVQTYHAVDAVGGSNLYRVSAINSVGTGDPSSRVSVTPPAAATQPAAPADLTAMPNGSREINLSWTAVPVADRGSGPVTQYKIEYSKNGMLPWMDLGTTTVTSTNDGTKYSNTGLAPGTTRHYRVSAVNIAGRGPVSTSASAMTTLAGVPAAPTGLTARAVLVAAENAVELYWTAPSAGGAPIEGYKIETSADNGATWILSVEDTEDASGTPVGDNSTISGIQTYHVVDATPAGKHLYRVSAINTIGTGPVSATVEVTPPVAATQPSVPLTVAALEDGRNEIEVTWEAPGTAGVGPVTQYKIEYSKDGMLPWMELATVSAPSLIYSNRGLSPDTTRYYRVSAVNKAGRGPASDGTATATTDSPAVTTEPGKPTGLTAKAVGVVGTGAVELSWTAPVSGRDSVTGYKIETSSNDGTTWTESVADTETVNTASGVQTYHAVDAVGGSNLYRVSAINSVGTGDPSATASVTPPAAATQPAAPADLTAMPNGSREINLSWTAVPVADRGSGPVTQYKIEYSKNGMLPWMDLGTTTVTSTNDGTKYSNTGLAPGTTRHYRVSAVNIAGRGPVSTSASAMTTLAGVPAAPTGLTARAVLVAAENAVELYWTAPSAGGAPIEGYKIETSADNGATWILSVEDTEDASGTPVGDNSTISGIQTYHVVDATPAGKHLYRVSAINTIGTGPVSATVEVTPPVAATQPSVPLTVAARADGQNEIEVTWEAPGTAGVGPVTQYKIEYSKDGMLPWMELATTAGTATKYENTGLDPDTTRHYRVSAINKAGRGPVSTDAAMATTDDAAADQMGAVTLSTQEPMVGRTITATLTDADGGVTGQEWQWQKSKDKNSWMDITGALASSYTPAAMDEGYYLRVTVTYSDKDRSDRIAQSMATGMVTLPDDRMGTVTLSPKAPLVDMAVTASVSDPDGGVTGTTWLWVSSASEDGTFTAIDGATSASYTPDSDDANRYLRAMATYSDSYRSNRTATSAAVMVTSDDRPQAVRDYDRDGTMGISLAELFVAIDDYFDEEISITDLFAVIDAYFNG